MPDPESLPLTAENTNRYSEPKHPGGRRPVGDTPRERPGEKLGDFIRDCMLQRHLTREKLAERAGISLNTLNNIIMGYSECPSLTNVEGLARALGISTLNIFANTSAVQEQDIDLFLQNQMATSRLRSNPTFLLIANALVGMSDTERRKALVAMAAIIDAVTSVAA